MTLWAKGGPPDEEVLAFSAGEEYRLDLRLIPFDCDASIAHAAVLERLGLLTAEERDSLTRGLNRIKDLHAQGKFVIEREQEDCHTAIEEWLTKHVGPVGLKIHVGRSRNDQVLTALRLYEKDALGRLRALLLEFRRELAAAADRHSGTALPGYTHMRRAMPTTAGIWLGAYVEAVDDDARLLDAASSLVDQSPLGTGAGYGIPVFPVDREGTARAMGFGRVLQNPVYAQMSRGKFEGTILHCLSQIMFVLNRLASDLLLFSTSEFGFVSLPEALCTGSSIMPQKRNPDILELVRGYYHSVLAAEFQVKTTVANLMSGYQRDLGLTKEPLFRAFDTAFACLGMMARLVREMQLNPEACRAAMTEEIYATEEAYRLVEQGIPFREAYRRVGRKYRQGLEP